jgi:hypothetical protein
MNTIKNRIQNFEYLRHWTYSSFAKGFSLFSVFCLLPSVFCFIISIQSCKVYSFTGANISPDIKSVTIEPIQNRANNGPASLNQNFTDKLKVKLVSEANLRQVANDGDLIFKGYFSGYVVTSQAPTAQVQSGLNRLTVTLHIDFQNTKDPKDKWSENFTRFADFPGTENLINVENALIEEINKQLVDDIFNRALVKW